MLLCYDIRDPRRLVRVYRRARRAGIPLQYSVFYLKLTRDRLNQLLEQIGSVIDWKVDDVRVYNFGGLEEIEQLGENPLPLGVMLTTK
jgi:CRISPR-associated protein Cas2